MMRTVTRSTIVANNQRSQRRFALAVKSTATPLALLAARCALSSTVLVRRRCSEALLRVKNIAARRRRGCESSAKLLQLLVRCCCCD